MRTPRIIAIAAIPALAGILAGTSQAAAHPRCQEIDATIYDKVVDVGCPPPPRSV